MLEIFKTEYVDVIIFGLKVKLVKKGKTNSIATQDVIEYNRKINLMASCFKFYSIKSYFPNT